MISFLLSTLPPTPSLLQIPRTPPLIPALTCLSHFHVRAFEATVPFPGHSYSVPSPCGVTTVPSQELSLDVVPVLGGRAGEPLLDQAGSLRVQSRTENPQHPLPSLAGLDWPSAPRTERGGAEAELGVWVAQMSE